MPPKVVVTLKIVEQLRHRGRFLFKRPYAMFFVLSKLFFYLLMPVTIAFYGLIYALWTRSPRRKQRAVIFTAVWLFACSNPFLVNELARVWEYQPVVLKKGEVFDVAVVLTGGTVEKRGDKTYYSKTVDRILQPLLLYKEGKVRKILISGGSGLVSTQADSLYEGRALADLLRISGVPPEDILLEGRSRNTHENALFTKQVLARTSYRKVLLVTSAFHMRRAVGCFRKEGIEVRPYPADFFSTDPELTADQILVPKEQALHEAYVMAREILGYVVYRLTGYV